MIVNSPLSSDSSILAEVIVPERGDLSSQAAEAVMQWKFSDRAVIRMTELAERNAEGTITAVEEEELQSYLRVGSLINLVQAKARLSLQQGHRGQP